MSRCKSILLLALCWLLSLSSATACDVCGGVASGGLFSIFPQYRQPFIAVRWHYLRFQGQGSFVDRQSSLAQWEIQSGIFVWKRFQILASIPINIASYTTTEEKYQLTGIGDMLLSANYMIFQTPDSSLRSFSHFLTVGGGLKIPTGANESAPVSSEQVMPANFQLGTGSWDYLLTMVYGLRSGNWAMQLDITSRINTINKSEYLFGDQVGSVLHGMYSWKLERTTVVPYGGLYLEYLGKDVDNQIIQSDTGGKGAFASFGLETNMGKYSLGVNTLTPIAQTYADETTRSQCRINAQLTFLF